MKMRAIRRRTQSRLQRAKASRWELQRLKYLCADLAEFDRAFQRAAEPYLRASREWLRQRGYV